MAAVQYYLPYQAAVKPTNIGAPGAKYYFYAPGTTTKRSVYADTSLSTLLSNPVIANGAGVTVPIYLDGSLTYKHIITDKGGAVLFTRDPYIPGVAPDASVLQPYQDAALASAVSAAASAAVAVSAAAGLDPTDYSVVTPQMFAGALPLPLGGGIQDDSAAFVAAIANLKAAAGNINGSTYKASQKLFVPAGHYYLGTTTLDITHTLIIEGEGGGLNGPSPASKLRWADGATGIRIQAQNTSGAGTVDGVSHFSGSGTILRGLGLFGGYVATPAEYHGVHAKSRFKIIDCIIDGFSGDGIYAYSTAGSGTSTEGNDNCSRIEDCTLRNCRNGFYTNGADDNAFVVIGTDSSGNRAWAFNDNSFLGNTYIGCHAATNVSGPYITTNANAINTFLNCYAEGDQPGPNFNAASIVIGGLWGAAFAAGQVIISNPDYGFQAKSFSGPGQWAINGFSTALLNFLYQGVLESWLRNSHGEGLYYNVLSTLKHIFQQNSSTIAEIDVNGIRVKSGSLGYSTGTGGTVTQATNKATGVTLSKGCGQITMNNAALLAAAKVSFVVTNTLVAVTDTVIVSVASGGTANAYRAAVTAVAAGSFTITVENITGGSLSEAPVINFSVIKSVAA